MGTVATGRPTSLRLGASVHGKTSSAGKPLPLGAHQGARAELYAAGKALRAKCPREAHAGWKTPPNRRDAVQLVLEAEKGRLPRPSSMESLSTVPRYPTPTNRCSIATRFATPP